MDPMALFEFCGRGDVGHRGAQSHAPEWMLVPMVKSSVFVDFVFPVFLVSSIFPMQLQAPLLRIAKRASQGLVASGEHLLIVHQLPIVAAQIGMPAGHIIILLDTARHTGQRRNDAAMCSSDSVLAWHALQRVIWPHPEYATSAGPSQHVRHRLEIEADVGVAVELGAGTSASVVSVAAAGLGGWTSWGSGHGKSP